MVPGSQGVGKIAYTTTNTKSQIQKHTHRPECSLKYLQGSDKIVAWELGNLNRRRLSSSQSSFVPLLQKALARFERTHNCTFGTYTQFDKSDHEIEEKCRSRKQCIRHLRLLVRQLVQRQHKDSQGQQKEIKNPEKHLLAEISCFCFV